MSIFHKDCPQCAATNAADAARCACGYCFDGSVTDYSLQDERLYADYLAARVVQAEAAATVARAQLQAEPDNTIKAAQALLAEQALHSARAELKVHNAKIARLRNKAIPAKPAPPRPHAKVADKPPKPVPPARHAVHARAAAPSAHKHEVHPAHPVPTISSPVVIEAKTSRKTGTQPPSPVVSAPQPAVRATTSSVSARPSPAFRKRQAVKADAVMRAKNAEPPRAKPVIAAPAPVVAVGNEPRLPAPAALKPVECKDCPNCTAQLASDAARCRCGYAFPKVGVDMPTVALDADTLALLAKGLGVTGRR